MAVQEEDLIAYLNEHIRYEREMLGYYFKEMHETSPGLRWNMVFESFCIHARNLYDFLRHEGGKTTSIRADSYVPGRAKPNANVDFNKLDTFLFHMSKGRIEKKKVDLAEVQALGKWLDDQWSIWVSSLKEPYAALVDNKPICTPRLLTAGVTNATACTYFTIPNSTTTTGSSSTYTTRFPE